MGLIRDFMLTLLITTVTGSLLMAFCMAAVYASIEKHGVHYVWWMLKGVLAGYLIPFVYLLLHRCIEIIENCYDIFSYSNPQIDRIFFILFLIWLVGVACFLLSQLHIWAAFWRIKRNRMAVPAEYLCVLQKLCSEMDIRKPVSLYQGYGVESPFIFGIHSPRIYLPVQDFSREELEIILYHELTHYKQGDTFWKPLYGVLGNIYWFNPLSHRLWAEEVRWAEANCDAYCCKERFQAKQYFLLLLEMGSTRQNCFNGYAPMWTEGSRELEWRIMRMKKNKRNKANRVVIAAIVATSVLGGGVSAYAATGGMQLIYYYGLYENTVEETEEPLKDENELQEYEGTVEDFAGMKIIEDKTEHGNTRSNTDGVINLINWSVSNNTTLYTEGFKVSAGGKIVITANITPSNKTVKIGIVKPDGKTSYVNGKEIVSHTFDISKTGTYKVFVSNASGTKVTINGFCTYSK